MKFLVSLFIVSLISFCINAQELYTISGTITDSLNGEHLVSVSLYDEYSQRSAASNFYGYFSLSLPKGRVSLKCSYIGYKQILCSFDLKTDTLINIALHSFENSIEQVVVTGHRHNVSSTQTGVIAFKTEQIKTAPVLLGESDLLKTIQLLPGVKGGTEGTSGLYVRGGGPDQNLILLDGVPVYNTSHAFGFFSVFNPDAIAGFTFYKGGLPARYGGRLSSVLDIKMKDGNNQKLAGEVSIGTISSKFTIEGPVHNEKTSFIVSGRRTFIDLFTKSIDKLKHNAEPAPSFYFYDLNAKINHRFNNQHRMYLSIYSGKDYAGTKYKSASNDYLIKYKTTDGFGWGNFTSSARWNYLISNRLFSNLTLIYSNYNFKVETKLEETESKNSKLYNYLNRYTSGIQDIGTRWDLEYYSAKNQIIRFGLNYTQHQFNPGISIYRDSQDSLSTPIDTTFGSNSIFVNEVYAYLEDEIKIGKFTANLGLHYSIFSVQGKKYNNFQPRVSLQYNINQNLSTRFSFGTATQYLHLLTNTSIGMPTDLWLPATRLVKPQMAIQYAAGLYYLLPQGYNLSAEVYYKEMDNLIEYKEGASFYQITDSWEDKIEVGKGKAQGIELMVQKSEGKLTGWIGTSLSKSDRTFTGLNLGVTFPYRYDSRFDISVLAMYKVSERINISATWVFHSGNAITLAMEKIRIYNSDTSNYSLENPVYVQNITARNNFRTPAYHRMDAGIDFIKRKKRVTRTFSIGLYNLYNHLNAFYIYADLEDNKPKIKQLTLFPIMPYFRYCIKF